MLLRKVSQLETEETAYKMTLLLNLLKQLLTGASDDDLQNTDHSQVSVIDFDPQTSLRLF